MIVAKVIFIFDICSVVITVQVKAQIDKLIQTFKTVASAFQYGNVLFKFIRIKRLKTGGKIVKPAYTFIFSEKFTYGRQRAVIVRGKYFFIGLPEFIQGTYAYSFKCPVKLHL